METILRFCRGIAAAGFHEESLRELLQVADIPLLRPHHLPSYLECCRQDNSQRAFLACLWLLTVNVRRDEAIEIMGAGMVTELIRRGYLAENPGERLKARVDLYPCLGVSVFTDPVFSIEFREDHVYQLGTDSYVLARVTPRKSGRLALDLCTGSGIQALLSAGHHQQVIGVDLNPRALEFAQFNSFLNRLDDRCSFLQGDLFDPVEGQRFDLITANPPFVPTPERGISLHRGVSETGEEISRRIVAALPDYLEPGGTLSMVLDYPIIQGQSYVARLCQWLSGAENPSSSVVPGWGVAVAHFLTETCPDYIRNHVDGSQGDEYYRVAEEYLVSYQRLGIEAIGFANVFVRRLPAHHPGFAAIRSMPIPLTKVSDVIEQWLSHLQMIHDPDWVPQRPLRLAHRVKEIWVGQKGGSVRFEFVDETWSWALEADGLTGELVKLIDGRRTMEQLLIALQPHPLPAIRQRLNWLLENLVVELVS